MKEPIRFISFYDSPENAEQKREVPPAAYSKMNAIIPVLRELGYPVEVVSMSSTTGYKNVPAVQYTAENGVRVRLFASFKKGSKLCRLLNHAAVRAQLLFFLLTSVRNNETVLVYHSLQYLGLLRFAKAVKRFRLILEMEEIYGDVIGDPRARTRELKLARQAQGFLFPTQLLEEAVNPDHRPSAIIHGTYQVEPDRGCRFADGSCHVVYAGTLDPRKGAGAAAEAARFLPPEYHIHILGFGNARQTESIRKIIADSSVPGRARVTYDGLLSGEEYIRFLQSCQIGLSTQDPEAAFNSTSFPSKILSYLANGLRVVSVRIPAIETSSVSPLLTYYEEQTPEQIAAAIRSVDLKKEYDSRSVIGQLNRQFKQDMNQVLMAVENETY